MSEHRESDFEAGVMVDVGEGAGALVIYTVEALRGEEIEISPTGDDDRRVHTDVLRRKTAAGYVYAAVFGSLAAGAYRLWHPSRPNGTEVHITSGLVLEVDWR
jgi:hypothetical protein